MRNKKLLIQALSLALIIVFGLTGCGGAQADTMADSSGDTRTLEPDIPATAAAEPKRQVIEGVNGASENGYFEADIPDPGEVFVNPALAEKMKSFGYDDVLFHVTVTLHWNISDTFKYEGKTLDEYRSDPALVRYSEDYDIWRKGPYVELDREMTAAEERGEKEAQGWAKHDPDQLFREYWYKNQPEDVIAAYELARQQYDKADKAYMYWRDSPDGAHAYTLEAYETECARLKALGYDIEVSVDERVLKTEMTGRLTRRQVEEFPASEKHGYMIKWAVCEDMGLFAASMSDTEKAEIYVTLEGYTWDEMMAAFKAAYPEEYEICVAEDARDPETPCPNPKEVRPALEKREKFCGNTFNPQKLKAFREKYPISDEDWIMGTCGMDGSSCHFMADKAMILRLLEDKDIKGIRLITENWVVND